MRTQSILKRLTIIGLLMASTTYVINAAHAQSTDAYLTSYIDALNVRMPPGGDPATVAELFAADGVQYHPLGGGPPAGPQRGREALAKFFAGFKDRFADWTHIEKSRFIQGNRAVWEGTAEGHDKKSGKPLRLPIVFFLEFDDQGKVRESRVYVNVHMIGEQLK
jgi:ketosteroid isomerase-like protein